MSWLVKIKINERDDAVALQQLIKEQLGFESVLRAAMSQLDERNWDTRLGRRMLESMEPGRIYGCDHFSVVLQEHEFDPKSQGMVLRILLAHNKIKRVGRGLYQKVVDHA